ncbi:MAG: diguanylate cyclase [Anaerolineales bacterium]
MGKLKIYTGNHEERLRIRIIRVVVFVGLLENLIIFIVALQQGSSTLLALTTLAGLVLLTTLALVRIGRIKLARYLLTAIAWLLANGYLLANQPIHPLLFVGVNCVVVLLAGAMFDHRGILTVGLLSTAFSIFMSVTEARGLVEVYNQPPDTWTSAGPIFALITLFSYYAFRERHSAMNEARQRRQETETLLQASHIVSASLDMEETIERILAQLERVVPYSTASAQIMLEGALEIVGGRGWENDEEVIGLQFPVPADNPNTVVIETRKPYILQDAREVYETFRHPPHDHIRSVLGIPLIIGDELIGMLSLDHTQPGFYNEGHARLVQAFADQVAIAIENARHFQAEQRRRQMAAMQQDITQITGASLQLEEVVERVASLSCQAVEADLVMLLLRPQPEGKLTLAEARACSEDLPAEYLERAREELASHLSSGTLRSLPPKYGASIFNADDLPEHAPESLRQWFGKQQGLIVPMLAAGHRTGLLLFLRRSAEPGFGHSEVEMVESIAQSVAASIENARLYAQMERMAITDPLTQLYNRRGLSQLGEREIERARRYERDFSVLLIDLDHFKRLNDTHGHLAGDEVLRQLASLLNQLVRNIDLVARYGGEEFAVLLPECADDCAHEVAERLRQAIESTTFDTRAGELRITVSLGVASSESLPLQMEPLLAAADRALYAAKEAGRNQTWIWRQDQPQLIDDSSF